MKKFNQNKIFGISWPTLIIAILFLIPKQEIYGQYISNNGTFISISSDTTVKMDTIKNDNATTVINNGTLNVAIIRPEVHVIVGK